MGQRIKEQFRGFLNTPPLWLDRAPFGMMQFEIPGIAETYFPNSANEIPQLSSTFVLGKRIELFFDHLLAQSAKFEVIAKNLQIFKAKVTVGELDFLIKNLENDSIFHIELVYKFYIYDPSITDKAARWIGPNRKDSLLKKITRLKDYQLPLLQKEETHEMLNSYNLLTYNIEQQVCFKATLFLPKGFEQTQISGINTSCIAGYWIRFSDFSNSEYGNNLFHAPAKQDWPIDPATNEEWIGYTDFRIKILELIKKDRSPLVWMQVNNISYERFFVVWW